MRNIKVKVCLLIGSLFLVLTCHAAWAQSTAQVSGTVSDPSGAILPGVEVTLTQIDTGLTRNVVTNETGSYVAPSLPVGPYRLEAALPGFRTYVQTGIVLTVAANPVINVTLEVGVVSETVEVQANAPQVETRSTGVSQVMDNVRVLELPLNGRQVTDLIVLSGAATIGTTGSFVRGYPTVNVSVAGGLANGLTFLLDGATHNDPFNNLNLPLPFPDALQEFKLETSGLSAQYGVHSAGTVNAVTKSGTNEFHGNVFEFLRNGAVNARNAFATQPDSLRRNQYGGTFGGPILKNKLFFFGAYQGTKISASPVPRFSYVPTSAMLAGDWTAIASPACNNGRQIDLRAPFVNNRIDPALFAPVALNMTKRLPTPVNACGEVPFGIKGRANEDVFITKVDYQISEKHSLFGRYLVAHAVVPSHFDPSNILTTTTDNIGSYITAPVVDGWKTQTFALGSTYLIGSNIVSSFRATVMRPTSYRGQPPNKGLIAPEDVGIRGIYQPASLGTRFTAVSVSGAFTIGGSYNGPNVTNSTGFQLSEDLSWVRGAHQFGLGANYIHSALNSTANTTVYGTFSFTATNTRLGLGDFMLGRVNTFRQASPGVFYFRQNYAGLYLQDTWKVNSRLTVNAGLRWDPFLPMYWGDGLMQRFNEKWFDQGVRSTVYKNAPAGVLYTGDPGIPTNGKVGPNEWLNFGPRLGLAWNPKGDGRMTIRSAYGLFRDYPDLYKYQSIREAPPWSSNVTLSSPDFADPWRTYPGGSPYPVVITRDIAFPTAAGYLNRPEDLSSVYVHQWNLSIQKQIGADWLVSANYIGNSAIHLLDISQGNPAVYLPGSSCVIAGRTHSPCSSVSNTEQRRKLFLKNPEQGQYYGSLGNLDAGGTMSYNGLLLTAQHRPSSGLTVQVNYTWSHCINTGTSQNLFSGDNGGDIPERLRSNRGNCAGLEVDRRHNFNLSTVYALPQFSNGTLRVLGTGWQVSGIVKALSGSYLSILSGLDNALSTTVNQRPDQVLASPYAQNKTVDAWLNPAAFAQPALGAYGNMGARNVLGPGFVGIDLGLTRKFRLRENQSIEFRAEAFNLPNHMNPGNPVTTLTSSTFGKVQSASDPRILQFALKYAF